MRKVNKIGYILIAIIALFIAMPRTYAMACGDKECEFYMYGKENAMYINVGNKDDYHSCNYLLDCPAKGFGDKNVKVHLVDGSWMSSYVYVLKRGLYGDLKDSNTYMLAGTLDTGSLITGSFTGSANWLLHQEGFEPVKETDYSKFITSAKGSQKEYYYYLTSYYTNKRSEISRIQQELDTSIAAIRTDMNKLFPTVPTDNKTIFEVANAPKKFLIASDGNEVYESYKTYKGYTEQTFKDMSEREIITLVEKIESDLEKYDDAITDANDLFKSLEKFPNEFKELADFGTKNHAIHGLAMEENRIIEEADRKFFNKATDRDAKKQVSYNSNFVKDIDSLIDKYIEYYKYVAKRNNDDGYMFLDYLVETSKVYDDLITNLEQTMNVLNHCVVSSKTLKKNDAASECQSTSKLAQRILSKAGSASESFAAIAESMLETGFSWKDRKDTVMECSTFITKELQDFINTAYFFLEIIVAVGVVILSMVDFTKASTSNDAEAMKKTWNRFAKRLIVIILIVLLPILVNFIIKTFNIKGIDANNPVCTETGV